MVSTNNSRERGPLPRRLLGRLRRLPAPVWTLATIVGACLIVASLILLRFGARLPEVGLQGLAIGGTLVNALLVSQATTNYGAALNSFAWLWVAIYAGQFFDQRAVRIQVGAIGVVSAAALAICGLPGLVTAWVLVAGSCILAGETLGRLNTRLRTQLVTDPLTGLLNRAGFGEAAERLLALAAREDLPVSVALIDLDGFKQINDLNGHAAGDELLVELGHAWAEELRDSEVLARLGGDEFALVLVADGDAATDALRRLRDVSPLDWSAGVVEWQRGESLEWAMRRADEQLYRAKRQARARADHAGTTGLSTPRQADEPTTPLV